MDPTLLLPLLPVLFLSRHWEALLSAETAGAQSSIKRASYLGRLAEKSCHDFKNQPKDRGEEVSVPGSRGAPETKRMVK